MTTDSTTPEHDLEGTEPALEPAAQTPPRVAVRTWNPTDRPAAVSVPLECSRTLYSDGTSDEPTASITLRRWTGRERLAYDDEVTMRAMGTDSDGDLSMRFGTLRLVSTSLTVVGSNGFGNRPDGTAFLSGDRSRIEADLQALDPDTYLEIVRHADALQPRPTAGDTIGEGADGGPVDPDDDSGLPDPGPTSSTPLTPTDDVRP